MSTTALNFEHLYTDLDRIIHVDDARVETEKRLLPGQVFEGHFEDFPIFPGVFMIEGVDNAVGIFAAKQGLNLVLEVVKSVQFRAPALPDELIQFDCKVERTEDKWQVQGSCKRNGLELAKIKLIYIAKKEQENDE